MTVNTAAARNRAPGAVLRTPKRTHTVLSMERLIEDLKKKIVEILDLTDVQPGEIETDAPLVGGDLGIDSIDVLEMVMMIEKDYGVRIDNRELGAKVFASLRTLAAYIHENSPGISE